MSMHYTTKQKVEQVKEKLLAAIDVGKRSLHVKYMDYTRKVHNRKAYRFDNSSKGFEDLIDCTKKMCDSLGLEEAVFGMEATGHYWQNLAVHLEILGYTVVTVNQNHTKKVEEIVDGSQRSFLYDANIGTQRKAGERKDTSM